jgi:pimeloyl-ACP methyl ester carboxylesterase
VRQLILIGYSGGGTLAVLLANQLPEAVGVITLAANLDIQAWATDHHFSPLNGSLNPASDTANLTVPHLALHGAMDSNVAPASLTEFQRTHPSSQMQFIDGYDHVCCWEKDWSELLQQSLAELSTLQNGAHIKKSNAGRGDDRGIEQLKRRNSTPYWPTFKK